MAAEPIAEALRRARRDSPAFSLVYERYADDLLPFIVRRVYEVDTAVDLMAETFARAFLKRRTFRGTTDAEAKSWIYAIAGNQISDYFRRSAVELRAVQRLGMEVPKTSEADQERIVELAGIGELRGAVRLELSRLSDEQQAALQLRVVEELPYEQVAERLGISQQAARARVARGLKGLSGALEGYGNLMKEELA
jgi:RNA polymerase sigma-70 factor (ECF subfamily)